jgi:hypothetical protein
MSLVFVDVPAPAGNDAERIANSIKQSTRVDPNDYVVGLHLGTEGVAEFVSLVHHLRCRALVIEPSRGARVLLEKNLWLNTHGDAEVAYCHASQTMVPDIDHNFYLQNIVILGGMAHNEFERASIRGKRVVADPKGTRCHNLSDALGNRSVVATVVGDGHSELAVRTFRKPHGRLITFARVLSQQANRKNFDNTLFTSVDHIL